MSILIGFTYQYFLSYQNLTEYLFDPYARDTLIDKNKEGVYCTIGYLSLSFSAEAVCYKLNEILREEYYFHFCFISFIEFKINFSFDKLRLNQNEFDKLKLSKKAAKFLTIVFLLSWLGVELSRNYVQNISRKMFNLSSILFIVCF